MNDDWAKAYRRLLFEAKLLIRPVQWPARSWNPWRWWRARRYVIQAGAMADWMHNLAYFSSVQFGGFNEEAFWKDGIRFQHQFPQTFQMLQSVFERLLLCETKAGSQSVEGTRGRNEAIGPE